MSTTFEEMSVELRTHANTDQPESPRTHKHLHTTLWQERQRDIGQSRPVGEVGFISFIFPNLKGESLYASNLEVFTLSNAEVIIYGIFT